MNRQLVKISNAVTGLGTSATLLVGKAYAFNIGDYNPLNVDTAEELAIMVIQYCLGIAGLVAVVYLIMGGFSYITAAGNEEQTKKATKTLLNAVIGLVIIFAAFAIVNTIQNNVLQVNEGGGTINAN